MKNSPKPLLILGTGTLAEEIADIASEIRDFRVAGFVENLDPDRCHSPLDDLPVYWIDQLAELAANHWAVCGLATTHRRRFIDQAASLGITFATIVHPSARVSARSSLGEGTIVSAGVVVASHTTIGCHVLINRGALIGHHTHIADYVTIQPGANIAGLCRIGTAAYIAMAAVIRDRITIGAHSVVGAGAVVTRDVPDNVQVLGVPARIVKENIEGK